MWRSDERGEHPVKHRLPPLIPRSLAHALSREGAHPDFQHDAKKT
jgi:hypothetical protein